MFVVKELGIQFTITNDIKDLVYSVQTAGDGTKIAQFSSTSLTVAGGKYCAADQDGPLGAIDLVPNPSSAGSADIKHLGSKYLSWTPPQATCTSDATVQNLNNAQRASFRAALDSATLTQ
jgi:hypothetical protein